MRLLISWLRDFVDVTAPPEAIADSLALRGFEVAAVEPANDGDAVVDVEITANRPDCMSVIGLAREVATIYSLTLRVPSAAKGARVPLATTPVGESDRVSVVIEDSQLCPRYAAGVAEIADARTPSWMTERLHAAGVRPISPVVDVTNYVLLELGQPMHAFDLGRLSGPELRIRRARPGEALTTLDGVARTLEPDMLVIADAQRAQAVAGVMGGAASEVSPATRVAAFESAYFKPASVRLTSKHLGLKTEASARFERGGDINAAVVALQRANALLVQIGAGRPIGAIVDRYPHRREPARIHLRRARIELLLGAKIPDAEVERILSGLELAAAPTLDGWDVNAPTFRVDLTREADLIEEIGRHYGFDKLAATFPPVVAPAPSPDPRIARDRLVRKVLTASGLSEAVTFGFIEARAAEPFLSVAGGAVVGVANPLSGKFDTLRPSIVPGLIDAVAHNLRHGRADVGLFEVGTRFSSAGETWAMGIAWTGSAVPPHWSMPPRAVDFYDVKGLVEAVCRGLGHDVRFEPSQAPFLEEGQAASVILDEGSVGFLGQVAPAIVESRGAPRQDKVYAAELDLDRLARAALDRSDRIEPLPKYPFVVRDLSIVVADTLPAAIIRGTIQRAAVDAAAPLASVGFFDRYQGKGVPEARISVSVRLTFQADDRTLTDAEVQQSVEKILAALVREHGAVQR